jgi:adenylosuccinate synthase
MLGEVVGVMKAYSTRVGNGPLPTELHDDTGHRIRERGREYGTTTGRPRRVGWLDLVAVKYTAMISGATTLALTLLDVLSGLDEVRVCTGYRRAGVVTERFIPDAAALANIEPVYTVLPGFKEDLAATRSREELPAAARQYVRCIEEFVGVRVGLIGVGPERSQTIRCQI